MITPPHYEKAGAWKPVVRTAKLEQDAAERRDAERTPEEREVHRFWQRTGPSYQPGNACR